MEDIESQTRKLNYIGVRGTASTLMENNIIYKVNSGIRKFSVLYSISKREPDTLVKLEKKAAIRALLEKSLANVETTFQYLLTNGQSSLFITLSAIRFQMVHLEKLLELEFDPNFVDRIETKGSPWFEGMLSIIQGLKKIIMISASDQIESDPQLKTKSKKLYFNIGFKPRTCLKPKLIEIDTKQDMSVGGLSRITNSKRGISLCRANLSTDSIERRCRSRDRSRENVSIVKSTKDNKKCPSTIIKV